MNHKQLCDIIEQNTTPSVTVRLAIRYLLASALEPPDQQPQTMPDVFEYLYECMLIAERKQT